MNYKTIEIKVHPKYNLLIFCDECLYNWYDFNINQLDSTKIINLKSVTKYQLEKVDHIRKTKNLRL